MKHLKAYKLFENIDTIINDLKDILLELQDENFNIRIASIEHHARKNALDITISKDGGNFDFWTESNIGELTPFKFIEVKEDLIRLLEYANSEGWHDFNFEIVTPQFHEPFGSSSSDYSSSFNGAYKSTVKIKDDEIVNKYQLAYRPIKDDEKILCVYIGLGK
jgi:hypothetical protein